MSTIKLSVTIELPGSQMVTSQECDQNPKKKLDYCDFNKILLNIKHYDKKTKKSFYRIEPLYFYTRKCIPAHQSINMTEEAFTYMTSTMCPEWYPFGLSKWKKLTPTERLELHLDRTCKALRGTSYTYTVFGD